MRKTFAPPSSLAKRLVPILKPRRTIMGESDSVNMRECLICAELKPAPRRFPNFPDCDHDANTCIDCYVQQAIVLIEQYRQWDAVTCPACNVALPEGNIAVILPRHEFTRLDDLVKKAALTKHPNWRWCLAPGCGHGQIYGSPVKFLFVKCIKCGASSCFKHQVKWHLGYTCDEYDMYHPDSAVTKTDQETIKKTTKACPHCDWRIQKDGGCSHMVCPKCHRAFFWNRLAFDGEIQPSSAEYVGGPAVRFPGLDVEIENAIMEMEGTLPRVVPTPERQTPHFPAPRAAFAFQHVRQRPVLGDLRLPAIPAPKVTSTRRRGAVDLSAAGRSPVHRDLTGARELGLRRSPRLRNLAGDLDEELRRVITGMRQVERDRTAMEERRERRASRMRPGNQEEQSDVELTEEDEIMDDPLAEYERRYEQRRQEREAGPWPPRFDSMETMSSVLGSRPSAMSLGAEDESEGYVTEQLQATRQGRLRTTGNQYSPSLRGGHQRLGWDAIASRTQQALGSQEERSLRFELQSFRQGYDPWAGMPPDDDPPVPQAQYRQRRMMELEETETRQILSKEAIALGRIVATTPDETRRSTRMATAADPLLDLAQEDEPEPVLPRGWRLRAEQLRDILPRNLW